MKKIILATAALASIGFGPAVYALPVLQGSNCETQAEGREQIRCQTCTPTRCYNCEVIGIDEQGNYIL